MDTLPEKVPVDAVTDPTEILGVPERPVALPDNAPTNVVDVVTPDAPN